MRRSDIINNVKCVKTYKGKLFRPNDQFTRNKGLIQNNKTNQLSTVLNQTER